MILPDINILVHAYNSDSSSHEVAGEWWKSTLNGPRPVGLAWVTILGFIRIMTHRGIFERPLHAAEAVAHVRGWLTLPGVQTLTPGDRHAEILFALIEHLGTAGNLTTDTHLAALAIEYQGELVSTDTDFARFPNLRWFNPIKQDRAP